MSHAIEKPTDITIPSTSLWAKLPMIGGVMAVIGLGGTIGAAFGEGKARAMFSYLFAYEALLGIALGALGFVLIDNTVRSSWSGVVKRIAETAMVTLPVFAILWLPIGLLGFHELYPWSHETDTILEKKRWFLSNPFFFGRAGIYFIVWAGLSWLLYKNSVKGDSATDESAQKKVVHFAWRLSAPGIALYALSQSFQAIDWLMSLQPHWYSTMFGVYFFAGSILVFFAFMVLATMGLQNAGVMKTSVTVEHFHDLGKFLYGFTIFWAYIAFSQFMLIWYANMPEETEFFMVRNTGTWHYISLSLPVLHFFVPFILLLSRHMKRNRKVLAFGAVWTIFTHLLDIYWLVMPNFGMHGEGPAHEAQFALTWTDFAAVIGMAGAFLAVFGYFITKNKVVAINEPRLMESLAHENY